MGTKVLISEEEYLRSSYGNPEPEFRDGELIERPMPTLTHGELIVRLAVALHGRLIGGGRLITATDVRVRIQPGLVRLPDFLVYINDRPPEIPTEPPFIVVEVLSPDDAMSDVTGKLEEYWAWGCPHVWLADPQQRKLYAYGPQLHFVSSFTIPGEDWAITPADLFEFPTA
jgi:Uma2 family endonuclease